MLVGRKNTIIKINVKMCVVEPVRPYTEQEGEKENRDDQINIHLCFKPGPVSMWMLIGQRKVPRGLECWIFQCCHPWFWGFFHWHNSSNF